MRLKYASTCVQMHQPASKYASTCVQMHQPAPKLHAAFVFDVSTFRLSFFLFCAHFSSVLVVFFCFLPNFLVKCGNAHTGQHLADKQLNFAQERLLHQLFVYKCKQTADSSQLQELFMSHVSYLLTWPMHYKQTADNSWLFFICLHTAFFNFGSWDWAKHLM